jgi:hypothetical protein
MATATIQVAYEAETSSLKATVNEINQINDKVVEGAQKAAKQSADAFKKVGESLSSAFAGENVKKALKNINVESLTLVKSLDKVVKEVKLLANTADEVAKLEDQLRELALAGKSNTAEFDKIAKAVGTYKSAITTADRAVEAYAKSTDAASSRVGILEDKLYDLAIAGQQNTQEFKDLVQESARLKKAIFETDQQVDSFVERGRKLNTVVQNVQLVGAAFQAVEGVSAAFGQENEELQKTLVKLNAVLAITGALEQARAILIEQSAKKTGIAAIAQSGYNAVVGTSNGLLKAFRIALAATGIGALVFAIIALVENFEKVKKAISDAVPGFEDVAKAVGKVIDKTKEFFGIDDGGAKSKAALDNLIGAEKRKTEFQVAAIDRRINILKAENKDTAALEIEKEQIQIASLKRQRQAIKDGTDELIKLDIEGRKEVRDTGRAIDAEILDRQNAIAVIRIQNKRDEIVQLENLEKIGLKAAINRKEQELKLNTEVSTAFRDQLQKDNAERIAVLELEKSINGESLQNTIDTIKAKATAEADALGLTQADSLKRQKITKDAEAAITAATKTETDKRIDLAVQYASAVVDAFAAINELSKVNSENRIAEIEATSSAELNAINASTELERDKARQRLALEKRTQQGIANEKTKQARQDKALSLFEVAINTASSIVKTGAQLGYPAAIPFQILAGAIGAIQLAAIAAKPLPKFEKGGLIGGKLHSQGGTLIEAEQGEYMVNRRQSAKHRRELDAMNTSTEAFRKMIDEKYVRPALMSYSAGRRGKEGVVVNASLNSKSMEKKLDTINKSLKNRNVVVNINQQDSRYSWQ